MTEARWFEVDIPRGPDYARLLDTFMRDFCAVQKRAGTGSTRLHHRANGSSDCYYVDPVAAQAYFLHPGRSALADWLLQNNIARVTAEVPDVKELKLLPC